MKRLVIPARVAEGDPDLIVSLSGGKDSTATALALREAGLPFSCVFADTGWEAAETYAHLSELEKHLGPIARVGHPGGFKALAVARAGFPARKQRWCTEELKIDPIAAYHEARPGDTVAVVGIRAEESDARALLPAWEDSEKLGAYLWRPILDWTTADVIEIHHRHGVPLNPLYLRGHNRVGCWPCIYSTKEELRLIAEHDPGRIGEIRQLEADATAERARRNEVEPGRYSHPQATFFLSREPGRIMAIDDHVTWARTTKGGRQLPVIPQEPTGGCFRWGLCEPPTQDSDNETSAERVKS